MQKRIWIMCFTTAVLLFGFSPAEATAQTVQGHVKVNFAGNRVDDEISVNAWRDSSGVAQGMMTWAGDVPTGTIAGPTDPWLIAVTNLSFSADGHTAYVTGVVVHSVFPSDIGSGVFLTFTDNNGTGLADKVDGIFVEAGNVVVRD